MNKLKTFIFLNKEIENFFPKTGRWTSSCFSKSNQISMSYLPCHTRDTEWLTSLILSTYKFKNLKRAFVREYVTTSGKFQHYIREYEQLVVQWQIKYMKNDGEGWIVDPRLGGDLFILGPKPDIAFRKGIVDTLRAIGMPIDAIEEGIEKNVELWRDCYMSIAFENIFNPLFGKIRFNVQEEINPELKQRWTELRLYEYYQDHRNSVDMYGEILPSMMLSDEEFELLKLQVLQKGKERLIQIKNSKTIPESTKNSPILNKTEEEQEAELIRLLFQPKKTQEN